MGLEFDAKHWFESKQEEQQKAKEVVLTRLTEEQVWLMYCLISRAAKATKPPLARQTWTQIHETAIELLAQLNARVEVNYEHKDFE